MARDIHSGRNTTLKKIANKQYTMEDTRMLDSSCLVEHPDNEYLFGMEGIDRLAEGMKRVGFKGAIEVWDMKDGTFLIYSGARRNRANTLLGNTQIKAFVYPYPESETERRRELLGANIYGRNAVQRDNAIYTARQINYLRETIQMERANGTYEGEKTREELAKEFGTSPSNIYKYESLLKLNSRAQEAVANGELQLAQGSSMSVLSDGYQDIVLDALQLMRDFNMSGARDEVQELVDYIKAHEGEPVTAEDAVRSICESRGVGSVGEAAETDGAMVPTGTDGSPDADMPDGGCGNAEGGTTPAQAGREARPFPVSYTTKTAAKKFNQYYGKMEEFLRADKQYKEKDREDVLGKLQQLKALIDSEISKLQQPGDTADGGTEDGGTGTQVD